VTKEYFALFAIVDDFAAFSLGNIHNTLSPAVSKGLSQVTMALRSSIQAPLDI